MNYITNLPLNNIFGITACYKQVNTKHWKTYHKGLDFVGSSNVYSVCDGIVRVIGWDADGWGRYVTIEPNGYPDTRFIFAHLQKDGVKVKVGDKVTRTTILGIMGSTGNSTGKHLHLEMRVDNKDVDVSKWCGVPNKVASNLNASNYKIDEKHANDYLKELHGELIKEETPSVDNTQVYETEIKKLNEKVNTLTAENEKLKAENKEYISVVNGIKKLIEKWS